MAEYQYIDPTETFKRVRDDVGDGLPGPDFRANVVAKWMTEILSPMVREAIEKVKDRPTGYDFADNGDLLDFREGIIAGMQATLEDVAAEIDPYNVEEVENHHVLGEN